jgi:hypothetical protein
MCFEPPTPHAEKRLEMQQFLNKNKNKKQVAKHPQKTRRVRAFCSRMGV